jgi:hypothetical protein
MAGAALAQAGCGIADSRSPVPEFMRARATEPIPPEPPPDVSRLVREQLDSVFIAASYPRQVQVSPPLHEPQGSGWTACVRAELTSATGQPLGTQTYRITIRDLPADLTARRRSRPNGSSRPLNASNSSGLAMPPPPRCRH